MSTLADLVPIPPGINPGLSACREDTMLNRFGKPGPLSTTCSNPSGPIKAKIRYGVSVGPFKVSGLGYAVDSLSQVFSDLKSFNSEAYDKIKTAGMLCVRSIRHNPAHYSNHSWGTAIDLYFGDGVVPQGKQMTQRGFLSIFDIFNRHGWFWGAGFSGSAVDSMHFELANETIQKIPTERGSDLIAAADYISDVGYDNIMEQDA